jgi:hypothetical protein
MLQDDHEPTELELGDFAYYGKVAHAGPERPPRDNDEPHH